MIPAIQGSNCHHTHRTQSYLFPSRPATHRNSNDNVRVRVFIVVHRYLATVAKRPPPRLKSPTSQCSMIFVSYIIFFFSSVFCLFSFVTISIDQGKFLLLADIDDEKQNTVHNTMLYHLTNILSLCVHH